jgi:hypothetical protein
MIKTGDIIEFNFRNDEYPNFNVRIKGFVLYKIPFSVTKYRCVTLSEGLDALIDELPEINVKLIESTNKSMFEYFGWDYQSINDEIVEDYITITIDDKFIDNYYTKTWNNFDTSKELLIKELRDIYGLEYNNQYKLPFISKYAKDWNVVVSVSKREFLYPV